ncbi:hypothetical protein DTG75_09315 [Salmonella enterica subsp. salamae]|uniref:ImpA domain-containing protein n=3 Tax=Salmonella enterica TaxID=28901 RepID=A0A379QEU3_SALER|nr:hypothetical protein LFZ47_01355 [Salmonella enterica subsp. salamae serovar 55:k:z39 str. 1315K]ECC1480883.1 hypothetical protein [Salmonella enterica subsp. salamae]EEL7718907.1 hypothetical protein [Salmonella enterica]ECC1654433.1 hypothetical protein [Salmonella enterica subsp. salamae]ECD9412880.1 hypothetical protein [Salmonella enterica subsp. salamae]
MERYYDWIGNHHDDILRGNNWQLNQRFENEIRTLKNNLNNNVQHIMLLTLDEAQGVIDDLLSSKPVSFSTNYAGNIRDTVSATKNLSKLFSYQQAGKIVFTLKGLGVKATQYAYQGKLYVKITGYPSLRRILNGTRYRFNHPKVLEVGIGSAGFRNGIMSGARFCIWFSACWRLIELIFKSDHDIAALLGNVTMDVAKVIVSVFVSKLAGRIPALYLSSFFVTSAAVPVWGEIVCAVALGFFIAYILNEVDEKYGLSDKLIVCIREGMKEQQKIAEWNFRHSEYRGSLYGGIY